jgi:hypothetical protein
MADFGTLWAVVFEVDDVVEETEEERAGNEGKEEAGLWKSLWM